MSIRYSQSHIVRPITVDNVRYGFLWICIGVNVVGLFVGPKADIPNLTIKLGLTSRRVIKRIIYYYRHNNIS